MTWLAEEPFWLILFLCLMGVSAIIVALNGGGKIPGAVGGIALLLALAAFVFSQVVETDREKLRRTVYQLAQAVEDNDLERTLTFLDPRNEDVIAAVKMEMPTYTFETCNILTFKDIAIQRGNPRRAEVDLVVYVSVDATRSSYRAEGRTTRGVVLTFEENLQGEWKMVDYYHFDPRHRKFIDARRQKRPDSIEVREQLQSLSK